MFQKAKENFVTAEQRDRADSNRLATHSSRVLDYDRELGLLLALEAVKLYHAREFGKVLREAMRIADGINEAFDAAEPWLLAKDSANSLREPCSALLSSGQTLGSTPTFQGGSKTLSLNLKAGSYKFFCSVPGHRQAGMEGTLTVK